MKVIKMIGFLCLNIAGCSGKQSQPTEKFKISIEAY